MVDDKLDLSFSLPGDALLPIPQGDLAIQFRETLMGEKGWSLFMLDLLKVCGVILIALRDTL